MNVVMPMAGHGSRFRKIGVDVPKPLIDVRGRPMYAWAMDSLPLELATRVIFVCLAEHLEDRALERDIRARYGHLALEIIPLPRVTQGQACTVLAARGLIDDATPLVIYNADTYCKTSLARTLPALAPDVDGVLSVFEAPGGGGSSGSAGGGAAPPDRWSFARVDASGRVVETAEKRRISPWATTGLYWFRHGRDFVRHADAMILDSDRTGGEYYVAPVYNRLIAEGRHIRIDVADEVWVLGTPEDLAHFEAHHA